MDNEKGPGRKTQTQILMYEAEIRASLNRVLSSSWYRRLSSSSGVPRSWYGPEI